MLIRYLAPTLLSLAAVIVPATATAISDDTAIAASQTFDYVIAGGGLTGLVVGNKLSAKGFSVLIIEAGKDERNNVNISNAALEKDTTTGHTCNFKYTGSAENGTDLSILIDSGNCLGGGTSINGMVWYRPTALELDALETLGNPGWNSATLFPYMTAVERNIAPTSVQRAEGADVVPEVHGHSGQVNVSFPTPMRIPLAQALYKAAIKSVWGLGQSADLSARTGAASSSTSWTIWYDAVAGINRRSNAAWSFLYASSQQRETLKVLTSHTVGSVIFKGTTAKGLRFGKSSGGALYTVYARREVILAAGSLASPAILERSGVGARAVLDQFGIKQVVELPGVGRNLQDQPGTGLSALVNTANDTNTLLIDDVNIFAPVIALPSLSQLFADDADKAASLAADLQNNIASRAKAVVAAGGGVNVAGVSKLYQVMADLITKAHMPVAELVGESYPSVMTSIFWPLTPLSRGHIHINSSSPFARPKITPRLLTDSFDVATAVALAKSARAMFESTPFSGVVSYAVIDAVADNSTDAQWASWYESTAYGASHWLGSTAMMPRAHGGVVSPTLKVYGTSKLRVVDMGVMPFQFTCHSMPVAYALAQRAAHLILGGSL